MDETQIEALANIAVIGPSINIRISAADPMSYVTKYGISTDKLGQQFIDADFTKTPIDRYPQWLESRAESLAHAGNEFLTELHAPLEV